MNNRIVPYLTKYIRRQSGFTLLELMIALALALVIISGVAVVVSQAVKNNRLLSTQVEIQNNIHIIHNRLGLIFKNAMSSPCGHLEAMLASENNPTTSHLKRAYKLRAGREVAQHVGKVVMPQSPLLPSTDATTIRQQDFPLFLIGIAGHPGEPKDAAGQPLSNSLPSIVKGSEYFIAMDLPDKLLLDSNHAGLSSVRDVHGGTDAGAAIKTTQIAKRLRGKKSVPWIITDCQQGTVFLSSADEGIDTSHNIIPVDNDLLFAHGYRDGETLLSSIEVYAYYLSRSKNEAQNNLSRFNLLWKKKAQAQRLMGGVKAMTFEWDWVNRTEACYKRILIRRP